MAKNRDLSKFPNAITVLDNGNVGIGATSPAALLHLNGPNVSSRGQLTIQSTDYSQISFYRGATTATDMVGQIYTDNSTSNMYIYNYTSNGSLILGTNGSTERLRITSGGNLLLGGTASKWPGIKAVEINASECIYGMVNGTTSLGYVYHNGTHMYVSNETSGGSAGDMVFNVNAAARMRITSSGTLGINTSSPTSDAKLDINTGSIPTGGYNGMRIADDGSHFWFLIRRDGSGNKRFAIYNGQGSTPITLQEGGGQVLMPSQPAFLAYGNGNDFNTLSGSYLTYPSVHLNRGGHYNASNGVFTAPIAGVYYFSWSDIGGNADDVYRFFLRVNNANFLNDYHLRLDTMATGTNYGTNGNRCAIVSLSANDSVRIYMLTDNTNTFYGMGATTNPYHTFMGYLIG